MSRNTPIPGEKPLRFMPFMAVTQTLADGFLVSWNGGMRVGSVIWRMCLCTFFPSASRHRPADYVYLIRVRFVSIRSGRTGCMTIGYFPFIKSRHGKGKKAQRILRVMRDELLPRYIAVNFDSFSVVSRNGFPVRLALHGQMQAVPHIVLYAADQPEERHVVRLRLSGYLYLCSSCMASKSTSGADYPAWKARAVHINLQKQLKISLLYEAGTGGARMRQLSKELSALELVPELASVNGLSSSRCALYQVFCFDFLYVLSARSFESLVVW